jgi:metacaspase-1
MILSYSGHGGQLPDLNRDEDDDEDETWCLYDGEWVDDELYRALSKFAKGVRVLVFSDSCHSGTVVKLAYYQGADARSADTSASTIRYRFMPPEVALRTYRDNAALYDPILQNKRLKDTRATVNASVLLFSGCQDNQLSADGTFNGLFTGNLLRVWRRGTFSGNYKQFHKRIARRMPPDQTPNYYWAGAPNPAFEAQSPFTI